MNKSTLYRSLIALPVITCQLLLFSCKNRNNPNLPEKRLFALMNELSLKAAETPSFTLPNANHVPQAGVRYDEIRAIDPFAPQCH